MSLLYNILLLRPSFRMARGRFTLLLIILLLLLTSILYLTLYSSSSSQGETVHRNIVRTYPLRTLLPQEAVDEHLNSKIGCRFHTCFEINNCSMSISDQIGVYVYPEVEFVLDESDSKVSLPLSVEYRELIEAVRSSRYYQKNSSRACVFVPSIDTLSQDRFNTVMVSLMLHALPP